MNIVFDGSFESFLTAIFEVYALKIQNPIFKIKATYTGNLFGEELLIEFDETRSKRVRKKLKQIVGEQGIKDLWRASLSEYEDIYQTMFSVIQYCLDTQKNILNDFGNTDVLRLKDVLKKIRRERHRMTAFVRFESTTNNIWTAVVEPDFDVLPLVVQHFKNRFADQQWLIYDKKRNYGIYYDLQTVVPIEMMQGERNSLTTATIEWDNQEKEFQNLWKIYFKFTNIESRKNNKLHLQHVPRRYWKYLSEKKPMLD